MFFDIVTKGFCMGLTIGFLLGLQLAPFVYEFSFHREVNDNEKEKD